jgi:hypothetical protein
VLTKDANELIGFLSKNAALPGLPRFAADDSGAAFGLDASGWNRPGRSRDANARDRPHRCTSWEIVTFARRYNADHHSGRRPAAMSVGRRAMITELRHVLIGGGARDGVAASAAVRT